MTPWTVAHQAGSPWDSPGRNTGRSPGDLPEPKTETPSLMSLALTGRFFTTSAPGSPEGCFNPWAATHRPGRDLASQCPLRTRGNRGAQLRGFCTDDGGLPASSGPT